MKFTQHLTPTLPSAPQGFKHPKPQTNPWAWAWCLTLALGSMATSLSAQTCPNGQTISSQYASTSSGGYRFPTSGSGAPDGSGISVYDTGTLYQGIFSYAETFSKGASINITGRYIDSRVDGIRLAFSTNGTTWTTNSALIGGFGAASAATYTTVSYTVPATLTGQYQYIRVQGNSANSYLDIDAIQTNVQDCFLFNASTFIDDGAGGGTKGNCIRDGAESITSSPSGLYINALQGSTLVKSFPMTNGQGIISGLADGTYTMIITNSATATTAVLPTDYFSSSPRKNGRHFGRFIEQPCLASLVLFASSGHRR